MHPKISVIVPVYNVEKYLDQCLQSILNQDYKNLEILLIDDKSTDSSLQICKQYEKKYKSIKVIQNEKNRGLSYTRNNGISYASGEYIGFLDSDDYIDPNYYSSLLKTIQEAKTKIAVCDIVTVTKYQKIRNNCGGKNALEFINHPLAASACNKLFHKSLFQENRFEVGKTNEDLAVILPLLAKMKASYTKDTVYYYVQRDNSIQNKGINKQKLDICHATHETLKKIEREKNYEALKDAIIYQQLINFLLYFPEKEPNYRKRYSFLKEFYQKKRSYSFHSNPYFKNFLKENGKINRLYYSLLTLFFDHGFVFFTNCLIHLSLKYKSRKKKVIDDAITLEKIEELAKMQKEKKEVEKKVSVVIPNYNYSMYLYERVYSILYQSYKIDEIIFLDDVSTDESVQVMEELKQKIEKYIPVKSKYNKKNVGTFSQWETGFKLATSPYVWIAEADDYSQSLFLETAMAKFVEDDVLISYVDSAFINSEGFCFLKSVEKQIDVRKTGHWKKDYIIDGEEEYSSYTFLNCTIANVSSAIIKKKNYRDAFHLAKTYRQAGDWMFYVNVMRQGKIAYTAKTYNYYRVHLNNVSTVTKKQDHLNEIKQIHQYFDQVYHLTNWQKEEIKKRYQFLKKAWKIDEVKK